MKSIICQKLLLLLIMLHCLPSLGSSCDQEFQFLGRPENLNPTPRKFTFENPNGGFLASEKGLYFAAPSAREALPILKELGFSNTNGAKSHSQLPDWVFFDVTKTTALSPLLKSLQSRFSVYDGPRCYTAACIATGWAFGTYNSGSTEFSHWARNFATEVPLSSAKFRDVITVSEWKPRDGVPVDHVATFMSPNIIFHKAAPINETPYEFITLDTFKARYPEELYEHQKLYRPSHTLKEYVQVHRQQLSKELIDSLLTLENIERRMDQYILTRRNEPEFPHNLPEPESKKWADDFSAAIKGVRIEMDPIEALAKKHLGTLEAQSPSARLWGFVKHRSDNLRSYPDPYD